MLVDVDVLDAETDNIQLVSELSASELLVLFEAIVAKRESTPEEFIDLARAFTSLGKRLEAYAAYSEAIARASDCRNAFLERGELLFGDALTAKEPELLRSKAEEALADYRMAVGLGSDQTSSLGIGSSLLLLNRSLEADCWFQDLLGQGEIANNRSYKIDVLFLHAIGRVLSGNHEGAELITGSIERLVGDECETLFILGVGALLDGQLEDCEKVQSGLRHKDPKLASALENLRTQGCRSFADVARALL